MAKKKICLLFGGWGGEREVSISSASSVYKALDKSKYEIYQYDARDDLKIWIKDILEKKFDLIFPLLHGPFGEDGKIQGMLEVLGVSYLFSNTFASALAMNKQKSKLVAKDIGLKVAPDLSLQKGNTYNLEDIIYTLSLPLIVKPVELGSSVGMTIAQNPEELKEGIEQGFKYDNNIILEKFIKGRELTVAVWQNNPPQALPVIEIIPKVSEWFDYRAKYELGGSEEICPAKIPIDIRNQVEESAVKIFKAIGAKDLARVDFIWSQKDNKLYFLEINTIPGMTKTSLVPKAAKAAGMEFGEFLDKLIKIRM